MNDPALYNDAELLREIVAFASFEGAEQSFGPVTRSRLLAIADRIDLPPAPSPVSVLGEIEARHAHPAGGQ